MKVLRVAGHSRATSVAGAVAWSVREDGSVEVQAIGAAAVNQATKAIAIARSYLALEGIDVIAVPTFATITINGEERTALRMVVEPRHATAREAPRSVEAGSGSGGGKR